MKTATVLNENPKKRLRLPKPVLIGGLAVLLIASAIFGYYYLKNDKASKNQPNQRTAQVIRGDLSVTVTGSGPVQSSSKYNISSNVAGKVTEVHIKDGDAVKAGDLLFALDDYEALQNIKKLEISIEKAQLEQESNVKYLQSNLVTSPINGEITDIKVETGDNLAKNAAIATITDKSKLKYVVPFINALRNKIQPGQEVTVNAYDSARDEIYTAKGKVTYVSPAMYTTGNGAEAYNVEILVDNPGSLKEGNAANAEINVSGTTVKSTESSTLSYAESVNIKTESGGTLKKVNATKGQLVTKGTVLAEFQNDELVLTTKSADLEIQDLNYQLETAKKQLEYYKVYSPIDGVATMEDINVGDVVKSGDQLCSVADYGKMEFEVPIDELDIDKINIGQEVNVTVDALPDSAAKPLKGTVSKIAVEGTSSNGVTTYPVTIQINEPGRLKGGMNANAEILVSVKKGTLYVPIEAVQKRGNRAFVMVKSSDGKTASREANAKQQDGTGTGSQNPNNSNNGSGNIRNQNQGAQRTNNVNQQYYAGAVMTPVQTGISNEMYIEIVSGLEEGQVVVLPPVAVTGQNGTQRNGGYNNQGGNTVRIPMGGGAANVRRD
ncbi:MAG: efflux RND transporter periplasmic adaptor subunit [Caulobacteraceae bacterium]